MRAKKKLMQFWAGRFEVRIRLVDVERMYCRFDGGPWRKVPFLYDERDRTLTVARQRKLWRTVDCLYRGVNFVCRYHGMPELPVV